MNLKKDLLHPNGRGAWMKCTNKLIQCHANTMLGIIKNYSDHVL